MKSKIKLRWIGVFLALITPLVAWAAYQYVGQLLCSEPSGVIDGISFKCLTTDYVSGLISGIFTFICGLTLLVSPAKVSRCYKMGKLHLGRLAHKLSDAFTSRP